MLELVYINRHLIIQVVNVMESPQVKISYDQVKQIALVVHLVEFQSE